MSEFFASPQTSSGVAKTGERYRTFLGEAYHSVSIQNRFTKDPAKYVPPDARNHQRA